MARRRLGVPPRGPSSANPRKTADGSRAFRRRCARAAPSRRARRFPADRGATPTTSGTSWFEGSTGDSKTNARSIALSSMTRRNRAMCAAARRAGRDSPYRRRRRITAVRRRRWRWAPPSAAASESHFSASSPRTPPRGSRRGASSCAWLPCSPRPSCGARRRPRSSGRRRDGPRTSRAAPSKRRAPPRRFGRRPRRRKTQTRTPPSSRGSLRPRSSRRRRARDPRKAACWCPCSGPGSTAARARRRGSAP